MPPLHLITANPDSYTEWDSPCRVSLISESIPSRWFKSLASSHPPNSRGPFLAIDFASLPTHLASSVLTYIYRCMSVLGVGPRTVTPHLRKGMMESSSGISLARAEAFLRLFAILVLVLTACLLGFDTQTKLLFSTIKKTATFRDLGALQ